MKFNVSFAKEEHDFNLQWKPSKIFPITILEFMASYNISVTTVYNEVIPNIKCWFCLKPWRLIKTIDTRKYCWHLCWNNLFFTSVEIFMLLGKRFSNWSFPERRVSTHPVPYTRSLEYSWTNFLKSPQETPPFIMRW